MNIIKKISRQREYQIKYKALGLCQKCSKKKYKNIFCTSHYLIDRKQRKIRRMERIKKDPKYREYIFEYHKQKRIYKQL